MMRGRSVSTAPARRALRRAAERNLEVVLMSVASQQASHPGADATSGPRPATSPAVDLEREVDRILGRWAAVGAAVGLVRSGRASDVVTRGVADAASGEEVTPDTAFRIASITKTLTAVAVMTLVEDGLLDLDEPVWRHLHSFRLVGPDGRDQPATLRHLLTHTSGLPEVLSLPRALRADFGESFPASSDLPSLAEYYSGTVRAVAGPGQVFCYTNHGPAVLGQVVEDLTRMPLEAYLRERVLEPWGMRDTDLSQSRRPRRARAIGYRLTRRGPVDVAVRDMVTVGAAAAWSTARDMTRYAAGLLGGGSNEFGTVLRPETVASMVGAHYRPHPALPGMGLGFFRGEVGGHPLAEHQGIIPGFDSNLVLAPDDGAGMVAMVTGARLAMFWLPDATGALLARLVGAPEDRLRDDLPQRPEQWPELCGRYDVPASLSDLRLRSIVGAGVQVLVRRGRLTVRCLTPVPALRRGVELHPDDPDDPLVFRFDLSSAGLGTSRIAFAPDPVTGRMALHLEVMPLTAYRRR
jgi:CubicO group peptidase (beta-lactamase class C family)